MKDFFGFSFLGLVMGLIAACFIGMAALQKVDLPRAHIDAAMAICEQANSTLVSADHFIATCANRAEIPYEVKE